MKENNVGDYEPKIKLICLNCGSPDLIPDTTIDVNALKLAVKMWIFNLETPQSPAERLYLCNNCKFTSQYPILRYQDANQTSTTKENNSTKNKT